LVCDRIFADFPIATQFVVAVAVAVAVVDAAAVVEHLINYVDGEMGILPLHARMQLF